MLMEVLTSMYSQILEENGNLEEPLYSMLRVSIRTSSLVEDLHVADMSMRQKMGILLGEDLSHQQEGEIKLTAKIKQWLTSSHLSLLTNFGNLYESWHRVYYSETSPVLARMHLGDSDHESRLIQLRASYLSVLKAYEGWMTGVEETLELVVE